nr:MAG TPA: hypothetical protein [Bacteriophage sp.]
MSFNVVFMVFVLLFCGGVNKFVYCLYCKQFYFFCQGVYT